MNTINSYELVCVFSVKENGYANGLAAVKEKLASFNCKITKEEDMADRALAFLIKKQDRGHYHLFVFEAEPTIFNKLDEQLKLQNDVLRHLIIKQEEPRKLKPKKEKKPRESKAERPALEE